MNGYPREDAAARAGVGVDVLDRIVQLGMVAPDEHGGFSMATIRKVGLIASLRSSGIPDDVLAAEIVSRRLLSLDFFDDPVFDHFSILSGTTFEDLAASSGIPVELLLVIREAIGSAVAGPGDLVREIELAVLPLVEAELASGYPPETIERLLRTMGDSLRRFVLAEADAFRTWVIRPVGNLSGNEIGVAAATVAQRIKGHDDDALLAIYHAQQAHAWTANILEGFEQTLAEAGLYARVEHPPAMCFLDLTGYTRLTAEQGDKAAAQLAERLGRLVQRTSVRYGGRPVKWLGDGVMFHFADPGRGVVAALEMADGVVTAGLPPAHVGLHAGPVLFQDGDYYGQTVNVASRIADYARPGEVLVSQAVADATEAEPVSFTPVGPVELKGVSGMVTLHVAHRA
jgi:adenylate cyclase